ncbi:XRE family transcriptional regulator [Kitasatospora sp. NPDC050463]|uniref:XRE family transcriptional regulator n=1 Tax=Kitasatospora sp. NPDC050463 TaxID=3155786 RepID=UPI0033C7DC27
MSALRRARQGKNWTLEQAVTAIDQANTEPTGLTASLLSAWELLKVRTSARYRELCCRVYALPAEILFADQDGGGLPGLPAEAAGARLVHPYPALFGAMIEVVHSARQALVITGSRSRESAYLDSVARTLADRPTLVHHRILYGPPRNPVLTAHLLELIRLRDPADRIDGLKTLHIGVVEDDQPERFFVASEREAVVVVPSLSGVDPFDTGIVLGEDAAGRLVQHAREAYAGSRRVETTAEIQRLAVLDG